MAKAKAKRSGVERREDSLSRERIVDAAIALLDDEDEAGLTFRALATRLATGAGAIYWHVESKSELLVAAADVLVARAMHDLPTATAPREAIHAVALALFDAIDAHPWLGPQLSRASWETAMLQIFERIGRQLQAMGVRGSALFTAGATLVSYILGVSSQNADNGRRLDPPVNRADFLASVAARWKALDAREYPFTRKAAAHLLAHDDREEFVAGLDIVLDGIEARI